MGVKSGVRFGGQGRCVRRIEVIVKMQKQSRRAVGDKGGCVRRIGGGPVGGGQGRCVRRIEVIVKMQKKSRGRGPIRGDPVWVRVDVYEELKFF